MGGYTSSSQERVSENLHQSQKTCIRVRKLASESENVHISVAWAAVGRPSGALSRSGGSAGAPPPEGSVHARTAPAASTAARRVVPPVPIAPKKRIEF